MYQYDNLFNKFSKELDALKGTNSSFSALTTDSTSSLPLWFYIICIIIFLFFVNKL